MDVIAFIVAGTALLGLGSVRREVGALGVQVEKLRRELAALRSDGADPAAGDHPAAGDDPAADEERGAKA